MRYLRSMPNRVLAGRLGVHPTTVSRWKGDPPAWAAGHIETLRKLEEALWPTLVQPEAENESHHNTNVNEESERMS
jgi:uncharacterized protein YjcR